MSTTSVRRSSVNERDGGSEASHAGICSALMTAQAGMRATLVSAVTAAL
jgi:hypothetical protein